MLDRADTVYYLVDGKTAAVGSHQRLLAEEPGYRALVARDADETDDPADLAVEGDLESIEEPAR